MNQVNQEIAVQTAVQKALVKYLGGNKSGASVGRTFSHQQRRAALTQKFTELAGALGVNRFMATPIDVLLRFSESAETQNQNAAELLQEVVDAFLVIYGCEQTNERANAMRNALVAIRAEAERVLFEADPNRKMDAAEDALRLMIEQACPSSAPGAGAIDIITSDGKMYVMANPPKGVDFSSQNSGDIRLREQHTLWLEALLTLPDEIFGVKVDIRPYQYAEV